VLPTVLNKNLSVDRTAHVACNFNRLIENEGRLKVAVSHVHVWLST